MPSITLAYSTHRPETLTAAADLMQQHRTVVLEEPKSEGFLPMLGRQLDIDTYLLEQDFEYPEFSRQSCALQRELHDAGIRLLQVDPFMDQLLAIHEGFAAGEGPGDIEPGTIAQAVYLAEKRWTQALIRYYEQSANNNFQTVVDAILTFARADAARGRLRDGMRAAAVAELLPDHPDMYLEAGYVHFALLPELIGAVPEDCAVRPVYLLEPMARRLTGRRQILGPGDILTLLYTFTPGYDTPWADLLAARSLIFIKLLTKEEIAAPPGSFPHTEDEARARAAVDRLSFEQCRTLYPHIRRLDPDEAWQVLKHSHFEHIFGFRHHSGSS